MTIYIQGKPVGSVHTGIECIPTGYNAFTAAPPKGQEKPLKRRNPQPEQSHRSRVLSALETPQERALRRVLRVNKSSNVGAYTQSDKDKSAALVGRGGFHGSNP